MTTASLSVLKYTAWLLLPALACGVNASPPVVKHRLSVTMDPDRGQLEVMDHIRLPDGTGTTEEKSNFT